MIGQGGLVENPSVIRLREGGQRKQQESEEARTFHRVSELYVDGPGDGNNRHAIRDGRGQGDGGMVLRDAGGLMSAGDIVEGHGAENGGENHSGA